MDSGAEDDGGGADASEEDLRGVTRGSVEAAVSSSCSTTAVAGLSEQIIEQGRCIDPDAFVLVDDHARLKLRDGVFPYLHAEAADALQDALARNPSLKLDVTSMMRTVAQQYLLYRWGAKRRCGVPLAARPGKSNHEQGLSLDLSNYSQARTALENEGFDWFGNRDKYHFTYTNVAPRKGLDVQAFQQLWNANNPQDKITADGAYGPATEARLAKSPASGFRITSTCE